MASGGLARAAECPGSYLKGACPWRYHGGGDTSANDVQFSCGWGTRLLREGRAGANGTTGSHAPLPTLLSAVCPFSLKMPGR